MAGNFLQVKFLSNVNWQSKLNKAAHHTSDYSSTETILRRGQAFTITLNFQTNVQSGDNFTFIASTGNSPIALTLHTGYSSSQTACIPQLPIWLLLELFKPC
uniref:Transglutaminase N-terminal domain-containing protein n=1 Tax=Dromaius novaehollandiae TaxID=8790 RepID=A0A8C4P661_DRONO